MWYNLANISHWQLAVRPHLVATELGLVFQGGQMLTTQVNNVPHYVLIP